MVCLSVCWAKSEVQQPEAWGAVQLHCGAKYSIDELTSLLVVVCELLCRIGQTPTEMFPNSHLDMYMASSIRSS